jgi:hypothetical protein
LPLSPTAIFVLGADRSGTSLVADLAVRWGAHPGDPGELGTADLANPRGYFEHAPMQELLRDLALAIDTSLWDPTFPTRVAALADASPWRQRAEALVATLSAGGRPWLFKEPLLGLYLGFWERILKRPPLCLVTVRNPHDAARSFVRASFPPELSGKLQLITYFVLRWQVLFHAILAALERNPDHLLVSYEAILKSPVEQLGRLCRFLDGRSGGNAGDGMGDGMEDRLGEMFEAIDPALWHQKSETSFFDLEPIVEPQKDLLRHLLRRAAGGPEPFVAERYPLPPYHREWLDNLETLRRFLAAADPTCQLSPRDLRRSPWKC